MAVMVVLVKQVPDYETETTLTEEFRLNREGIDSILDETNEHAVEAALQLNASLAEPMEIVALTMGPAIAVEALRRALAMGADRAFHICDERIAGSDVIQTGWILAHALGAIADTRLVMCGDQSSDGGGGVVPAIIAEYLGIPALTSVHSLSMKDGDTLTVQRASDGFTYELSAQLPALVSVTEQINEPRFPSFKGIMAAKKKAVEQWTLDDLGVLPNQVGGSGAGTQVTSAAARPTRTQGDIFQDNGDGAQRIMDYLTAHKLV